MSVAHFRSSRRDLGESQKLIAATPTATMTPTTRNGLNTCQGAIPAEFMMMSSESLPILVST
jgi:hypothetical protein